MSAHLTKKIPYFAPNICPRDHSHQDHPGCLKSSAWKTSTFSLGHIKSALGLGVPWGCNGDRENGNWCQCQGRSGASFPPEDVGSVLDQVPRRSHHVIRRGPLLHPWPRPTQLHPGSHSYTLWLRVAGGPPDTLLLPQQRDLYQGDFSADTKSS